MYSQGAFSGISQSFKNYYDTAQQATMAVVLKIRDLRNDTEIFLKVSQVALATLHLITMHYPATSLSRLSFALATANMHDFYRVLQQPRQWFFPVTAQTIDEHLVLEDLTEFIYLKVENDNFNNEEKSSDSEDDEDFNALRKLLHDCLKAQLGTMNEFDDAYRSLDEFKDVVNKRLEKMEDADFDHYAFEWIELKELQNINFSQLNEKNKDYHVAQWIRHVPLVERMTNLNWSIVDIGCVGLFLQGWNLLDTAKWAERMGQYPVFQWVKNHHLETWVLGFVCTAFSMKLFEAVRKLCDEVLTPQDKRQARWNVITSAAECVLFGAIFLNHIGQTKINNVYVQVLAIGAKSLGVLNIITRPKREFFQKS